MFLATQSCDGVKVKKMRIFETEEAALNYLLGISFGRIWELYPDKKPRLVYPARDKKQ